MKTFCLWIMLFGLLTACGDSSKPDEKDVDTPAPDPKTTQGAGADDDQGKPAAEVAYEYFFHCSEKPLKEKILYTFKGEKLNCYSYQVPKGKKDLPQQKSEFLLTLESKTKSTDLKILFTDKTKKNVDHYFVVHKNKLLSFSSDYQCSAYDLKKKKKLSEFKATFNKLKAYPQEMYLKCESPKIKGAGYLFKIDLRDYKPQVPQPKKPEVDEPGEPLDSKIHPETVSFTYDEATNKKVDVKIDGKPTTNNNFVLRTAPIDAQVFVGSQSWQDYINGIDKKDECKDIQTIALKLTTKNTKYKLSATKKITLKCTWKKKKATPSPSKPNKPTPKEPKLLTTNITIKGEDLSGNKAIKKVIVVSDTETKEYKDISKVRIKAENYQGEFFVQEGSSFYSLKSFLNEIKKNKVSCGKNAVNKNIYQKDKETLLGTISFICEFEAVGPITSIDGSGNGGNDNSGNGGGGNSVVDKNEFKKLYQSNAYNAEDYKGVEVVTVKYSVYIEYLFGRVAKVRLLPSTSNDYQGGNSDQSTITIDKMETNLPYFSKINQFKEVWMPRFYRYGNFVFETPPSPFEASIDSDKYTFSRLMMRSLNFYHCLSKSEKPWMRAYGVLKDYGVSIDSETDVTTLTFDREKKIIFEFFCKNIPVFNLTGFPASPKDFTVLKGSIGIKEEVSLTLKNDNYPNDKINFSTNENGLFSIGQDLPLGKYKIYVNDSEYSFNGDGFIDVELQKGVNFIELPLNINDES